MGGSYRTAPAGIYQFSATMTSTTTAFVIPYIVPCDSTILSVSGGSSAHTGGTYGVQNGTLDVLGTAGNRVFPTTGTAEIVKGASLTNRKILRGSTLKIYMTASTSLTGAQVTVTLRPEAQVETSPTDD